MSSTFSLLYHHNDIIIIIIIIITFPLALSSSDSFLSSISALISANIC